METTLDTFRSSTWGWLRGTLAGWGTLLLIPVGLLLAFVDIGLGLGLWPLALAALGFGIILVKWVQNLAATFIFTDERLIVRRGIIFKSVDEIELYRVKDCRIDFTLINQWADIGTISVSSSDETTRGADLVLRHVENARARREELRRLVDAARQKRSVREIDMIHDHP